MKNIIAIILVASSIAFASDQPSRITQSYYLEALDAKPLFNEVETPQKKPIYESEQKVSPELIKEPKANPMSYDDSNIKYESSSTGIGGAINKALGVKTPHKAQKKSSIGQGSVDDFMHNFLGVPRPY